MDRWDCDAMTRPDGVNDALTPMLAAWHHVLVHQRERPESFYSLRRGTDRTGRPGAWYELTPAAREWKREHDRRRRRAAKLAREQGYTLADLEWSDAVLRMIYVDYLVRLLMGQDDGPTT